jgi:hypothetical protein
MMEANRLETLVLGLRAVLLELPSRKLQRHSGLPLPAEAVRIGQVVSALEVSSATTWAIVVGLNPNGRSGHVRHPVSLW